MNERAEIIGKVGDKLLVAVKWAGKTHLLTFNAKLLPQKTALKQVG